MKAFGYLILILLVGCGSSTTIGRLDTKQTTDVSGRWNDSDSRLVAEAMVKDLINKNWLRDYELEKNKKPVVIVGRIRNLSSEHIAMNTFVNDMARELINGGKVVFVADKEERKEIRNERMEQQSYSSVETTKELAEETGADFILQGSLTSITDAIEGQATKYYQVDLELINIGNNQKVWIGSHKIKKMVERSSYKW
ncbi:MAG: penicillin-binding protein activator LpoB [Candidatus Cloacimonetes bacterium]|nr:penicillin-binding protein activator LpoB [Candidatus Cloacimonadota bacterium]MCF8262289.1 penicillin-binding protein activator LpoB [Melioribacteraceae bacterium]